MKKFSNFEDSFNNNGIWNKITASFDMATSLIRIKKTIIDVIREVFLIMEEEIRNIRYKIQNS